jgi:hypothetical protein
MTFLSRRIAAVAAAAMIAASPAAMAREGGAFSAPISGEDMLYDLVFVRTAGFVGSVIGAGTFVLTLPFSLLGQNVEEAARQLVLEPGAYTFVRPLGHFETCRDASGVC